MGCFKSKPREPETLVLGMVGLPRSGKSTLAKQLKFIHVGPNALSAEDLENFAEETRFNLYTGVQTLIKELTSEDQNLKNIKNRSNRKFAKEFLCLSFLEFKSQLGAEKAASITELWNDKGIKEWVAEYGVEEIDRESQLSYVISQLPRILMPDYLPNEGDCVRARQRTTGLSIVEYTTKDPRLNWKLVDMGGQNSERRKWQYGLKDAKGVIFCIALDEFDRQSDTEGCSILEDAANTFQSVATSSISEGKIVFLFLNKTDLFFIKRRKMEKIFEDYDGGKDYDAALRYIKDKVLSKLDDITKKQIYVYDSCALDKKNVQKVFDDVMRTVHKNRLHSSGLLDKDNH